MPEEQRFLTISEVEALNAATTPGLLRMRQQEPVNEDERLCSRCRNAEDECLCWKCRRCCEYFFETQPCDRCDRCEGCCNCLICTSCGDRVGDTCSHCNSCESCCECVSCNECGDVIDLDNGDSWCGDCEFCENCCTCNNVIREHDADASVLGFKGSSSDSTWFGVELEVEAKGGRDRQQLASDTQTVLYGDAICKEDSSIDNGFEIVTAPATLEEHRRIWRKFFESHIPNKLTSWVSGRCGMHVHISKPNSPYLVGKMLVFINSDINAGLVNDIAGRDGSTYAKRLPKKLTDGWHRSRDRYQALNIDTGKGTVELRIFRGTLNRLHFWANLEFAHGLRYFCDSAGARELTWVKFNLWVSQPERRATYSRYIEFMKGKGYVFTNPKTRRGKYSSEVSGERISLEQGRMGNRLGEEG